jgi:lysophospholipase L1-like esterase
MSKRRRPYQGRRLFTGCSISAPQTTDGDHLHPGPAGYKVMGSSIPLSLFEPSTANSQP